MGAICLLVFFLRFVVFRFQESPKFLLYRGKDEKAVKVLRHIARFNGRESAITLEKFEALTNEDDSIVSVDGKKPILGGGAQQTKSSIAHKAKIELERYKILFSTKALAFLTILIWIIYMFDYWGFSIAGNFTPCAANVRYSLSSGSFLPKILLKKNTALKISRTQTYRDFVIIYVWGIPGVILGALMYGVKHVGRKWAMVGSSTLMAVSLFLFATVNTEASNIGLNAMEYFFQSMFNAVLYGWTPEAFPAPIRGTACGIASFFGRLFSIISPIIAQSLLKPPYNAPLYLAGGGVFVCTIALILIPTKSMGAHSY